MPSAITSFLKDTRFYWFLGHVSVLIGCLFYSLWSIGIIKSPRVANFWYKEVYGAVISTYGISLYETYGRGRGLNAATLIRDENVQYLLASILWFMTTPFFGTLPPFAIFSVLHTLSYIRSYVLPVLGFTDQSPLGVQIGNFTRNYNGMLMIFAASSEFFVFMRLILFAFTFRTESLLQAVVYFVFFKLRYNTSQYTRHVVKTWEVRIDGLLSHPSLPPVVKQVWIQAKSTLATVLGPLFVIGEAGEARKAPSSLIMLSTRHTIGSLVFRQCTRYSARCYSSKNKRGPALTPEAEALDFANRKQTLLESSRTLYPLLGTTRTPSAPVMRIPEFRKVWDNKIGGENPVDDAASQLPTDRVTVQGRIKSLRKSGKGLIFLDLIQDLTKLQVVINRTKADMTQTTFDSEHSFLRRGDIVSVSGQPWRTKAGELSLLADNPAQLLAPCLHPLPTNQLNATTRSHNRVVDLAVNKDSRDMLMVRSTVMSYIREFFVDRGFLEVQTPMLADRASGATANPFTTYSKALGNSNDGENGIELALRIAPELWLKRLVVAGFDKVFEVGQSFRNEGIDATHNPEFTTCEFYEAYATLNDLMATTQQLLRGVVDRVRTVHGERLGAEGITRLDELAQAFAPDFKCLDFVPEIEKCTGVTMPSDLSSIELLADYFEKAGLNRPSTETTVDGGGVTAARLLDKLAGIYLEPQCGIQPTFIMNHPQAMAPLAKSSSINSSNTNNDDTMQGGHEISRRFELFINGKEYVNAYEEENSPFEQASKFRAQLRDRLQHNDLESQIPDDSFVSALEWGLPPTGGFGLGIDRLCMLLTGAKRIEQVLAFGGVKTVNYQ